MESRGGVQECKSIGVDSGAGVQECKSIGVDSRGGMQEYSGGVQGGVQE